MTKKLIALLLLILLAAVPAYAEETDETLLDKVIRISEDGEELLTLDEEELMDVVGIDPESYTDFAYLAGRDTSQGRELIVLLATDSETAEQVVKSLENYLGLRLRSTQNYYPEAYRALNDAEVMRQDLLVVLSIGAPDPREPELLLQGE